MSSLTPNPKCVSSSPRLTFHPQVIFFIFELLLLTTTAVAISTNLSYTNKYKEMSSVANTVGQIPCSVRSFEDVAMILWFKDSAGSPIYSYDARNEKEPRHLTLKNDWGLRLYFRVWPSSKRSPALMIRDLKPTDAGLYRCRVDYRNSPTANSMIRLKVIEPPTHLEIRDTSQSQPISDQQMVSIGQHSNPNLNDITYLGPYVEGQNVTVVCTSYGGKPLPEVIWYENGLMVDASYELVEGNHVTNELSIVNLSKKHSHDLYTCQASNNNETKKISHRINLDVYLAAKHIELDVPDQMTAGALYNMMCKVVGAYPSVKIEFWKMQKRIGPKYQIKSDADNVISSEITFKPEVEDDEAIIHCRAENPWINGKQIETRKRLHVKYTPVAVLRFGSSKTANFSEGESVLLECHVKSNPELKEISWFHGEDPLSDDRASGIVINGFTLLLRHLTHLSGGSYTCEATNDVGKGTSNSVNILVNIPPRCMSESGNGGLEKMVPLALGERHELQCNILAWPSDLNFYWTLNRSKTLLPIQIPSTGNRYIIRGTTTLPTTTTTTSTTTTTAATTTTTASTFTPSPTTDLQTTTILPVPVPDELLINYNESEYFSNNNISISNSNDTWSSSDPTFIDLGSVNETVDLEDDLIKIPQNSISSVNDTSQNNCTADSESSRNCPHRPHASNDNKTGTTVISFELETDSKRTDTSTSTSSPATTTTATKITRVRRRTDSGTGKGDAERSFHHYAVIPYEILSDEDYGTVACWAENSYAKQLHPCIFHIISPNESNLNRDASNPEEQDQKDELDDDDDEGRSSSSEYLDKTERVSNFKTKKRKGKADEDEDDEEKEAHPLSSQFQGTLGIIIIILMGLLIFVGILSGCSWLLWTLSWKRKVGEANGVGMALARATDPEAENEQEEPTKKTPLIQKKITRIPSSLSSSTHNEGKATNLSSDQDQYQYQENTNVDLDLDFDVDAEANAADADGDPCRIRSRTRSLFIDIASLACCSLSYQSSNPTSHTNSHPAETDTELEEKEFTGENENCREDFTRKAFDVC